MGQGGHVSKLIGQVRLGGGPLLFRKSAGIADGVPVRGGPGGSRARKISLHGLVSWLAKLG